MDFRVFLGAVFSLFASISQLSFGLESRFKYGSPEPEMSERFEKSFGAKEIVGRCLQFILANEEGSKLLNRLELLFRLVKEVSCLGLRIDPDIKSGF